jgi:hypothetical protein
METYSMYRVTFTQPSKFIIIGFSALKACSALFWLGIPRTVTRIGETAFYFCEALEEVRFDVRSRLELIKDSAFGSCNELGPVDVPARAEYQWEGQGARSTRPCGRVEAPQNSVSALLMLK